MGRDPKRIFQEGEVHTISYSSATVLTNHVGASLGATPPRLFLYSAQLPPQLILLFGPDPSPLILVLVTTPPQLILVL